METLISCSDYPLFYNDAWENYTGFCERGDEDFPLAGYSGLPPVLSFFGSPAACQLSVLCADYAGEQLCQEAYRLGLTLGVNMIPVSLSLSPGKLSHALRRGLADSQAECLLFVRSGLSHIRKTASLRRQASQFLINGGAVCSPFMPEVRTGGEEERLYIDFLSTRKPFIMLLGLEKSRMDIVESALDEGSEIFIHSSFLAWTCAKILAGQGAQLFSTPGELKPFQDKCSAAVYPSGRGRFSFMGKSYDVFRQ